MRATQIEKLNETAKSLGYSDVFTFASNHLRFHLMSKMEGYKQEVKLFEKKYKSDYTSFLKKVRKLKKEDFEKEDDIMDWEWAVESINHLEKKLKSLQA